MSLQEGEFQPPVFPSGRMIIKYLQTNKDGATLSDILNHLRLKCGNDSKSLSSTVLSLLENGTALGFIERLPKSDGLVRECCGRRRKLRRRRRRSCGRRRRRRSCRRRRRRSCRRRR